MYQSTVFKYTQFGFTVTMTKTAQFFVIQTAHFPEGSVPCVSSRAGLGVQGQGAQQAG